MKNFANKVIIIFCLITCVFLTSCTQNVSDKVGIANPWTDCKDDLTYAGKITGFDFPLVLSNYKVRAMKDMIEITYPLDEMRDVVIRKTSGVLYKNIDISGNYNNYPINDTLILNNGVKLKVRRDKNLIYVAYIGADSGYYSINCLQGMTEKEVKQVFEVIAEVEAE